MPAGVPLALDPNRLMQIREAAAQGDPQAQQILQSLQGGGPPQGGGMPPMQGAQPMPPAGAMPPAGGMVPPGQGQLSPQGGGAPIPPDVQARRAQQLIQLLRARGAQQ